MSHPNRRMVTCPCGAIVEAPDDEALVVAAGEHTWDAHRYRIPRGHVLAAAEDIGEDG